MSTYFLAICPSNYGRYFFKEFSVIYILKLFFQTIENFLLLNDKGPKHQDLTTLPVN